MDLKRYISKALLLLFLLLVTGCATQPAITVDSLPGHDALFDNAHGWTGADGAYSLSLSNDTILWLFGDTWLGDIRDGQHENAVIVNNTAAIQSGLSPPRASVKFYFSQRPGADPTALIQPADGRGWFWIYHGVETSQGLYLFLIQIERIEKPSESGFRIIGTWLGHVTNPHDRPDYWKISQLRIPWTHISSSAATFFGSWVLRQGPWLYIYGSTEDVVDGFHRKYMILARVSEKNILKFDQWRFYVDGRWVSDFKKAERLCGNMANEYSVSFLSSLGKFIVVYSRDSSSHTIAARFARYPWGPWSQPMEIYQCPEMNWDVDIFCYAAKGHPDLTARPDELIVTYVANSTDFYKMAADTRLYRPRFIRIRFGRHKNR